ncbi:MAG: DUF1206 domain-containing protein [Rubrobacteraceae bacterium]
MAGGDSTGREAKEHAEEAARRASPWIERMARLGYAAYGTVYALVGALAAQAAFGGGGEATGQSGALTSILSAPLGRTLLGVVAFGLLGYAMWRLIQGTTDPDNECDGAKGVVKRADHVANAVFHAALAFTAAQLALGSGGGGGGSPDDYTATIMSQPFGRFLVLAVGIGILAAGAYQFRKACKTDFMDNLKPGEMRLSERRWAIRIGRVGYSARGVVFGVIGAFVVQAAATFDPRDARGLGGALETLSRQPFGPYLLGAVALGLIAYGAFMFVVARYRRVNPT